LGKRIRVQRRGRGSPTFRASTHGRVAPVCYPDLSGETKSGVVRGQIIGLLHEPGRGSPLAVTELETGKAYYSVVSEGIYEGQLIELGEKAALKIGNVLPIGKIPEGTVVCNIELSVGDGGKLARSSGSYATVISHTSGGTMVKLPSGKTRYINDLCLATIGVVSAAGRVDKPFLKAGRKFHLMRSKGHKYPRTRGIAMVAAVHPHGSSKRGARKARTVSRNAPPGQKVGYVAASRTGRKKRK